MPMTPDQARELHAAVDARNDAWRNLNNYVLMPIQQVSPESVSLAGMRFVAAERAVQEAVVGYGLALSVTDVVTGKPEQKQPVKRRGRPPKAKDVQQRVPDDGKMAGPAEPESNALGADLPLSPLPPPVTR